MRRWAVEFLISIWSLSIVRACAVAGLSRRAWYRGDPAKRVAKTDAPVIDALNEIISEHNRWGFWMCFHRLRNLGHKWNHKRVWRIYKAMKLNLKRRTKRRLPDREPATLDVPAEVNNTWSFDFMSDTLYSGLRFRVLNIIDEGVREALEILVDTSITAKRLVRVLDLLKSQRGVPKAIRVDNGPEMTAQVFADWCSENDVRIDYIEPGKPNQNAYIERFNRSYREELLDPHIFSRLTQVRDLSWAWLISYNEERPHSSHPPAMRGWRVVGTYHTHIDDLGPSGEDAHLVNGALMASGDYLPNYNNQIPGLVLTRRGGGPGFYTYGPPPGFFNVGLPAECRSGRRQ